MLMGYISRCETAGRQTFCIETSSGRIVWDIAGMILDMRSMKWPVIHIKTSKLRITSRFYGDSQYAMQTDMEEPCIVVELGMGMDKLVDGNHRLYKASRLGIEHLPCYYLPMNVHRYYINGYDEVTYERVISEFVVQTYGSNDLICKFFT